MSLDGFVADAEGSIGWINLDDQVFAYYDEFISQASTAVYGPKTFQMMEVFWPGMLSDPKASGHFLHHAKWYATAEKLVFSKTLQTLSSPSARLIKGDLAEEIEAVKKQDGKNIMIFGSPRLVHSFAQRDLIDEYIISVNPVILGEGTPMFKGIRKKTDLKLISSSEFSQGGVVLRYTR